MKYLFIHNKYPAQFIHIVNWLGNHGNEIVFICKYIRPDININNIKVIKISINDLDVKKCKSESHKVSQELFYTAEAYAAAMLKLKDSGYLPDVILAHPGWGGALYVKDIFPSSSYIIYCEWFYNKGELHHFFSKENYSPVSYSANRHRNFYQLSALSDCDLAITPTHWQHYQYPLEYSAKINVVHDGIDTDFFRPGKEDGKIGTINLSDFDEIVSYATRGLEPYRGFPQFYKAIPYILSERPYCHIVIMADDRVCYSAQRKDGKTWLQYMQEAIPNIDVDRVHYVPYSSYINYRKLLRYSTLHIYMTVPFILSWSLLEAMSCACLILASNTSPVREAIVDKHNGFFTSFWNSKKIAYDAVNILKENHNYGNIRRNARQTIIDKFDLRKLLPIHLQLIDKAMQNNFFQCASMVFQNPFQI